jgi:hypothetical protein
VSLIVAIDLLQHHTLGHACGRSTDGRMRFFDKKKLGNSLGSIERATDQTLGGALEAERAAIVGTHEIGTGETDKRKSRFAERSRAACSARPCLPFHHHCCNAKGLFLLSRLFHPPSPRSHHLTSDAQPPTHPDHNQQPTNPFQGRSFTTAVEISVFEFPDGDDSVICPSFWI